MIRCPSIQYDKSVMKHLRLLYRQCRILCIEINHIPVCKRRTCICINLHINAGILLCQNVQRIHIYIPVNQDNLAGSFSDDGYDQAERIINLTVKEYLLLRFCMILNVPKHLVKLLIRAFLIFQLFQFHMAYLLKE